MKIVRGSVAASIANYMLWIEAPFYVLLLHHISEVTAPENLGLDICETAGNISASVGEPSSRADHRSFDCT